MNQQFNSSETNVLVVTVADGDMVMSRHREREGCHDGHHLMPLSKASIIVPLPPIKTNWKASRE
jgi:hypothetical protein